MPVESQLPECFGKGEWLAGFVRSSNVSAYLLLRSFPGSFFKQRAALLGDPDVRLPALWQAWVMMPMLWLYVMVASVLIANTIIKISSQ